MIQNQPRGRADRILLLEGFPNLQNLNKLLSKRLDLILIPRSTALFYSRRMGLNERLHFSAEPLNSFSRHLLLQPNLDPEVAEFVTQATASLQAGARQGRTVLVDGGHQMMTEAPAL